MVDRRAYFLKAVACVLVADAGRRSAGSAYSPNHGMFTTKNVAVSEAGISSPDSACLHLQENLERVKEIGRGASGIVYKAIHIPTLKVVAIKVGSATILPQRLLTRSQHESLCWHQDVPVYGRGQRRQMVRELHALYSNLVPISDNDSPGQSGSQTRDSRPKYVQLLSDIASDDATNSSFCVGLDQVHISSRFTTHLSIDQKIPFA